MTCGGLDAWLVEHLACPRDHYPLRQHQNAWVCSGGHAYPTVDGIPILLVEDAAPTHGWCARTLDLARCGGAGDRNPAPVSGAGVDAFVQQEVVATCGNLYQPLLGKLLRYPIPEMRLPPVSHAVLLDIGCNWGRWSISAARKGYTPVGIDPSLEGIRAARRVSRQLGVQALYLVADARYLPFQSVSFDVVFSYSVLQHFSRDDVRLCLAQVARVLKPQGTCLIQLPNRFGLRSLEHQLKRRLREAAGFEVRYWSPAEMKNALQEFVGPASLAVDGYFGLGIQPSDLDLLRPWHRAVVHSSEALRGVSKVLPFMKYMADSLYVKSTRIP